MACPHNSGLAMHKCKLCKAAYNKEFRINCPEVFMWESARARAARNNVPFSILPTDVVIPEFCPVFGIPLDRRDREHTPSIDEIHRGAGYVKGNFAVVSGRANRIKSDATVEELEAIIRYMKEAR